MPQSEIEKEQEKEVQKEKVHSDKAFRQVSDDMHKYKQMVKDQQEQLDAIQREREEEKRKSMEKNQQFEDLYNAELKRNEELVQKLAEKDSSFLNVQKLNAVKDKLGQFKKPEYNKFIDTSRIIVDNDGNIDQSTVDNEVNRLKQEYPELIKVKAASALPDEAPESGKSIEKSLHEMTAAERQEIRRKLIEERSKQ